MLAPIGCIAPSESERTNEPLAVGHAALAGEQTAGSEGRKCKRGPCGARPGLAANGETLVFESIRHKTTDEDGNEVVDLASEMGAVDDDVFQRYARPFAFAHESLRYNFAAWRRPLDGGGIEEGVRVTAADTGPANVTAPEPPVWVHPDLAGGVVDQGTTRLVLRLKGFPDWDVPLLPDALTVDALAYADALEAQVDAKLAREALLDQVASDLASAVAAAGGVIHGKLWTVGWLDVELPSASVAGLISHPDVLTAIPADAYGGAMGAGRTDLRPTDVVGVQPYWNASQLGNQPNPNRHGFGAITVAVVEVGPVKDEASVFCTSSSCMFNKFAKRYRCDGTGFPGCSTVTNYTTTLENFNIPATNHATIVASSAVGDYMDNQPMGFSFDRPAATSDAREAKLIHFGALGGWGDPDFGQQFPGNPALTSYANALTVATLLDAPDIITSGTFVIEGIGMAGDCPTPSACSLPATLAHEQAAENAFDNGAFLSILPSNSCGPAQTTCTVASPAHIPKVFTVNGIGGFPGCASDYRTCQLDGCSACCGGMPCGNSARGGATARIGTTNYANAVSVIDLGVPQNITHFTRCAVSDQSSACSSTGILDQTGGDSGTSFAAPRLAGLAALAKDYFLDTGQSWFNNPGWLHVYMLGQGDSHRSSTPGSPSIPTARASVGADMFYGLGRVKMRHPSAVGLYGHHFKSVTFTTTSPHDYLWGSSPLAQGTQIFKCVMAQHEDMSHKDNIAHVKLEVWLRDPVPSDGRCSLSGSPGEYLLDASRDTKKMVAFRGSSGTVGGKCPHVRITPLILPSNGQVWTQVFCYAAGTEDDAPN